MSYEGSYELSEEVLADGSVLDDHFAAMGGWIASTLVRLGDLKFEFRAAENDDDIWRLEATGHQRSAGPGASHRLLGPRCRRLPGHHARSASYHWFLRDEWSFLSGRSITSVHDLFRPHALSHWSTVPVVVYRLLWFVFGARTYLPYQALVVVMHLAVAVLLRQLMRRAGVDPWVATIAAAPFILFGPGDQNIVWAFQIGFTGSIAFGLAQLLLSTHDGPIDRRDWLGLGAGLLALDVLERRRDHGRDRRAWPRSCSAGGASRPSTPLRSPRLRPLDADRASRHGNAGLRPTIAPRPRRMGQQLRAGHLRGPRAATRWSPC